MPRLLDTQMPVNRRHPLNACCQLWAIHLPHTRWVGNAWNIIDGRHGTGYGLPASGNLSQPTSRPGGFGEYSMTSVLNPQQSFFFAQMLTNMTSGTIAGWFYMSSTGGNNISLWTATDNPAVDSRDRAGMVAVAPDGTVFGTGAGLMSSTGAFGWSQWNHVCLVCPVGIYVNGILVVSGTTTITTTYPYFVVGGASADGYYNINGMMDDVRIWTRTLSQSEILEYIRESQRGYPNLLNWRDPQTAEMSILLEHRYSPVAISGPVL